MKEVELDISKSLNIEKKLYEEKEYPDKEEKRTLQNLKSDLLGNLVCRLL